MYLIIWIALLTCFKKQQQQTNVCFTLKTSTMHSNNEGNPCHNFEVMVF